MKWVRKKVKNFYYMFMGGLHEELRNFYNGNIIYDPIKVTYHEMRMQKWENKIVK